MEIKIVKVSDLVPYENNPSKNDGAGDAVANSIKEFGFKIPLVIDKDNVIVCGHTRLKAAKKLKIKEVPCVIAEDLTEEQIKAFRLADNKSAEIAEWDVDLLVEELKDITEIDMTEFGFDVSELDDEEIVEDDFDEELPEDPITQLGDIWELGNHRLICGDSTDPDVIAELMRGGQADLLLTDPPYNVDYEGKTKDALKIQNDKMGNDDFHQFLREAFFAADTVMKPGAVFYIWHADSEGYNFRGACFDVGWTIRECLIWNKNSMVLGRQDYQWKHEPCLYGWKDGAGHYWGSDRSQTTVIDWDRPTASTLHPTMKPIGLFAYQIENSSRVGDNVLDLFGGSGTTLMACEELDRNCFMCELDPRYCDVIIKRWEDRTGKKAVKAN